MAVIIPINRSTPNDDLGNTLYEQAGIINDNFAEVNDKKVEKETGKGLTENDFTDADKAKLDGIEENAQVNVIPNWAQEDPDEPDYILNKPTIPETTQFIYDGIIGVTAGFVVGQTSFELPSGAVAQRVYVGAQLYYKSTVNNGAVNPRWSQSGNTITITKTTVLNNYIYIEYV